MKSKFKHYFRLFLTLSKMAFSTAVISKFDFWSFVIGKMVRIGIWLVAIDSLFRVVPSIIGFNKGQMILLYATMNLIDILVQVFFFRGFHALQHEVRKGNFDFALTKPVNPLVLTTFRYVDFMDVVTLIPSVAILVWAIVEIGSTTFSQVLWYILLTLNGLVVVYGIGLIFGALTFYTTQMENIWWFYRYGMSIGRFPVDIYSGFFKFLFTFIMPIAVIVTFPAKAYFGILSLPFYVYSFVLSAVLVWFGVWFWNHALAKYQSASS